jgi:spore germination cell wall hydrolase CwlJ-like protein
MNKKEILECVGAGITGLVITGFVCFAYAKYDTPTWKANEAETETETQYIEVDRYTPTVNLVQEPPEPQYKYYFTDSENEDLCKIAMAEAGNQGTTGKALVMRVVLNRMEAGWGCIQDIIRARGQFTAYSNGSFDKAVPDAECEEALRMVESGWDESFEALYFESGNGDTWHSRNLDFLFQYQDHKFYK